MEARAKIREVLTGILWVILGLACVFAVLLFVGWFLVSD
jgi:hypothetical protein